LQLATPGAEDDFGLGAQQDSFKAPAFVVEPAVEPFARATKLPPAVIER
jgi:hypothetical protein